MWYIGTSFKKLQTIDLLALLASLWTKDSFVFSDEKPMLETLDYTIRIGSTPTILYFDLYLYSAYRSTLRLRLI